ncbi:MAG: nuclear transport factor 2 family protein [Solirubrobacterales bacterium]
MPELEARFEDLSPDQRVARLWATKEIQQLAYSYAYGFDMRDIDLLRSLWAKTDEPAPAPILDGHVVNMPDFEQWLEMGPSVLFVGNHRIVFDDDENAHGAVYTIVQVETGGKFVDQSIFYQDRYTLQDGRWLFVDRDHQMWFGQVREQNPYEQSPANWPESTVGSGTVPYSLESYQRFTGTNGSP